MRCGGGRRLYLPHFSNKIILLENNRETSIPLMKVKEDSFLFLGFNIKNLKWRMWRMWRCFGKIFPYLITLTSYPHHHFIFLTLINCFLKPLTNLHILHNINFNIKKIIIKKEYCVLFGLLGSYL